MQYIHTVHANEGIASGCGDALRENMTILVTDTLPKTNIAPENRPSQKETSISTIHFQGRTVSFREGKGKTQLLYKNLLSPTKPSSPWQQPRELLPGLFHRSHRPVKGISNQTLSLITLIINFHLKYLSTSLLVDVVTDKQLAGTLTRVVLFMFQALRLRW